jgi:hypothetical protein
MTAWSAHHPPMESNANPAVIVNGLNAAGVELISPENPNFDSAVMSLLPTRTATVALDLKPFVVIVSNQSAGEIVAYTLVWKVTSKDKRTHTTIVQFKYPDAIAGIADSGAVALEKREGQGLQILSHQKRVVAKEFEVGPSWEEQFYLDQLRSFAKDQKQEVAAAEQIEIDLDAAIFSDGLLVGPNRTDFDKEFMTYFEAKQNLFRQIVKDVESGRDLNEAFAPLKVLATNHLVHWQDKTAFYGRLAAQEINAFRKRIGDSTVRETFKQAIRKEPFLVHRSPR